MGSGFSVPDEHPDQSKTLYNGKVLEPLPVVDEKRLNRMQYGAWSDVMPEQLSRIIKKPERYNEAIRIINSVSQTKETGVMCLFNISTYLPFIALSVAITLMNVFFAIGIPLIIKMPWFDINAPLTVFVIVFLALLDFLMRFLGWVIFKQYRVVNNLQKAVGQANVQLLEEKILMGARSNLELDVAYVSLDGCKLELCGLSHGDELFKKYISEYSGAYIGCLSERHFPFKAISQTGHLDGALCFCQYVIRRLSMKRCCYCFKGEYVYSPTLALEEGFSDV